MKPKNSRFVLAIVGFLLFVALISSIYLILASFGPSYPIDIGQIFGGQDFQARDLTSEPEGSSNLDESIPTFGPPTLDNGPESGADFVFGYGADKALKVAELKGWEPVSLADYIMAGHLFSNYMFTVNPEYDPENISIEWNIQYSPAPSTYNLGLQTLDMVAFLAYAFEETGDTSYLWRGRALIESWLNYVGGENLSPYVWYDHSVASRTVNLIYFLTFMASIEEQIYTPGFVEKVVSTLRIHAEYLYDDNNYYRNSNHGIMSDRSLIAVSLFLDPDESQLWYQKGIDRIRQQFEDQFTEEFVHVENSPGYALGVIQWFIDIEEFLNQFGKSIVPTLRQEVDKGLLRFALFLKPNLYLPLIGDTFAAKPVSHLPSPESVEISRQLDFILSQGAEGSQPEETFWVFPEAGYALMRSGWQPSETYPQTTWLLFKCR